MPYVTIAVSHNNRIQQFLKSVFKIDPVKKIRFLNCAVLKIVITPDSKVNVKLLHSGDIKSAKKEKGKIIEYYVNNLANDPVTFIPELFPETYITKSPPYKQTQTQIIYLVRHGLAMHNPDPDQNVKGNILYLDAPLRVSGFFQAKDAAKIIANDLADTSVDFLMASDLVRSRQTLATIYTTMLELKQDPNNIDKIIDEAILNEQQKQQRKKQWWKGGNSNKDMIVVPCLNEIPTEFYGIQLGGDLENFPDIRQMKEQIFLDKFSVNVDWKYYNDFYKSGIRTARDLNCPETTDIIEKISDIISKEISLPSPIVSSSESQMNAPFYESSIVSPSESQMNAPFYESSTSESQMNSPFYESSIVSPSEYQMNSPFKIPKLSRKNVIPNITSTRRHGGLSKRKNKSKRKNNKKTRTKRRV